MTRREGFEESGPFQNRTVTLSISINLDSLCWLLLLFLYTYQSFSAPSLMPAALKNRKPSGPKPTLVGSTPAAKSVMKSTSTSSTSDETAQLVVYNVVLEDDGSPAQAKTVRSHVLSYLYSRWSPSSPFLGTPRQIFSSFIFR
jgi:hypothetical protein